MGRGSKFSAVKITEAGTDQSVTERMGRPEETLLDLCLRTLGRPLGDDGKAELIGMIEEQKKLAHYLGSGEGRRLAAP